MSRIARAAELAKKVLGTDRGARNKELMQQMRMDRMLPGRAQNLAETVLKTPSPRSGGLSTAAKALGASTLAEDIAMTALGAGSVGVGGYMLKDVPPEELGKMGAQLRMSFSEMLEKFKTQHKMLQQCHRHILCKCNKAMKQKNLDKKLYKTYKSLEIQWASL